MKVINLTQHTATPDQIEAGVVEPKNKEQIKRVLTFNNLPSKEEVETKAMELVDIAKKECVRINTDKVMVGGAPFLMPVLDKLLRQEGITPLYAFSKRVTEEVMQEDGTVRKVQVFKHEGFVDLN
jgi:hypothetical protein